ncbi:Cytochrome P450 20A1 [Holothuria leucospilota]|uniref:Cytochrome P450 20A1 n=1 Tax=Holothuria leucospilota TaxID=206669 RepID=A0A9Q0YLT9_HOLLE|nr:Cytochrome P450 20A1 [Holothuria leucospilota]
MITTITFVAAFVAIVLVAFVYIRSKPSKAPTVPGLQPVDYKGKGNLPDIKAAGSLHEFLVKLHKQYGPIASFWFGPTFTVSVASPDILQDLKRIFDRPPELFRLFEPLFGPESIQYCNGTEGKTRRKTTDPAFSHDMLRHFCENFNKLGEEAVSKLASLPRDEHIPICQTTLALTIKGLSQTSFGAYFKSDDMCYKLQHNYELCWHEMERRVDGDIPESNSERQKRFIEALETIKGMVKDIVKLRQESPPQPHERGFIDILMDHTDIYPERKLLDDAMTYMIGGFHTSGHLLAWTLYFLAKHKDVQEKVFKEVISIVGKDGLIGPEDMREFVYIRQVMNESLRLSVLAPWAARFQEVDVHLGGYIIPKGTPVITALGVVLQDEAIWPLSNKFDPERFSEENVRQRHQFAFQPFGLPGRICPGYRFAFYELTVFLAILIRNFKWSLVEGQAEVERVHAFVTSPKEEIWTLIEKRE